MQGVAEDVDKVYVLGFGEGGAVRGVQECGGGVDELDDLQGCQVVVVVLDDDFNVADWMCRRGFEPVWVLDAVSGGGLVENVGCLFQLDFVEFVVEGLACHVERVIGSCWWRHGSG